MRTLMSQLGLPGGKGDGESSATCHGGAEEGLEHLDKQYGLQQNFHTTYAHTVDEVSEALQATSAANRCARLLDLSCAEARRLHHQGAHSCPL